MEAHIHCQVGEGTPEKKVEQIFHKPQVPPVLDILEMNGHGVSKHIVVAVFLACAGGYVGQVMDDTRLRKV